MGLRWVSGCGLTWVGRWVWIFIESVGNNQYWGGCVLCGDGGDGFAINACCPVRNEIFVEYCWVVPRIAHYCRGITRVLRG